MKDKKVIIITTNAEGAFDKTEHDFMNKNTQQLGIEGNRST